MADYQYYQMYGCEPWSPVGVTPPVDYGGGAEFTNQNLILSLWSTAGDNPDKLLVPVQYTTDFAASNPPPGFGTAYRQGYNSRTSAKILVNLGETLSYPILAILNPPQDLKTSMQNAFKANNTAPYFTDFLKPSLQNFDFEVFFNTVFLGNMATNAGSAFFSGVLTFAPFFATNGMDGVAPVPLPVIGTPNFHKTVDAFNSGDFFVGAWLSHDGNGLITINWPHTVARG